MKDDDFLTIFDKKTGKKLSGRDSSRFGLTEWAASTKEISPEKGGQDGSQKNIQLSSSPARIKPKVLLRGLFILAERVGFGHRYFFC